MAATPGRCLRGPGRDPRGRGPKAAAVLWWRLRVSLLAAAERRWSRSRRRRSVLPPQAARSPGQWRPERQRHGQQRREAARAGSGGVRGGGGGGGGPCARCLERLQGRQGSDRSRPSAESRRWRQWRRRGPAGGRALLLPAVLLCLCCRAAPERLRYAIAEELPTGSLVGPLARDLGLSPDELPARKLRVSSAGKRQLKYFTVNEKNGNLYVNERLDREELCGESASCSVNFEALVHNPLNVFHVEVAIQDVNDNDPRFLQDSFHLEINELTSPGARFAVGMAEDADVGSNSLQGYELETNAYFAVEVKESQEGSKFAELVLRRALDRESESSLRLVLTALDGGDPPRSGTAQLWINVTDANDNPPVFAQGQYHTSLREDTPPGSTVLNISASDADAGTNAHITYGFGKMPGKVLQKFVMDAKMGTITLKEGLDFEDTRGYALLVEARDGGGLVAHCKVEVEVLDVNDNAPEIEILSLSSPVPEDAPAGTVVALLKIRDRDSGENGEVSCELSGEAPLSIVASSGGSYKVVTASALDREQASEHRVTVVARDRGRPALWSEAELVLEVSDVNDNSGEVRTARAVSERDAAKQRLVAVVKDHGQPALSATATLHVVLADSLQEALPELSDRDDVSQLTSDLNLILVLPAPAPLSSGQGRRCPSGEARRRRRPRGGALEPCALCSYWTGLCVPLSANDGAGGNWRPGPARSRDEAQTVSERLWE
ncbi:protocadherin gamma-B5-like [Empidonax traillii]|uniref:protocadherin gamma-B5-like n=1 Tax=Empidonax traillii TaxID=164674 RepID=UPI000FFD40F8|nr:protocadherin gamma-B5-like [Empidonax traillii]